MSVNPHDILELSNEAVSLHGLGSLEECSVKLSSIREKLLNIDRGKLDSCVIWNLSGIVSGERSKWTEDNEPSAESLDVAAQALFCLRNTFVNCSQIQLMVAETDDLRDAIVACVKWVFLSKEGKNLSTTHDGREEEPSEDSARLVKLSQLATSSITCLGNLVAANAATRKLMWPYLLPLLRPLLKYPEQKVSYLSSMVIFNCLLEQELKEDLCNCGDVDDVIRDLLTLYVDGESSSEKTLCFVLYTLEVLLCCDRKVNNVWSSLSGNQQLLLLEILKNILEGRSASKCGTLSSSSVVFLISIFKREADKILRTLTNELQDDGAMVIARLLNFLCSLAASECWSPTLQEDKSLLITTVSLLQCMKDIGSVGKNGFSCLGLDDVADKAQLDEIETHPAYGFKCDLIRLIASLVYRHKINQDQVREMNGVTLVLESSQFDARNPGIKEVSIFAVRNLLEGNLANQQIVKDLEFRGTAENQALQLTQENGMVVLQGSSSSSSNNEQL